MNNKVLIVSFFFPPSQAIGGRRWAYLAKYLQKANYEIFVIASDYVVNTDNCPWGEAIREFKRNIVYLKHQTPFHIINKTPKKLIGKINYKSSLIKSKLFKRDSIYDGSSYFADDAYNKAVELINKYQVKNVIVTGGPFHLVYKISQLKHVFGDKINLAIDLRDPWTEHISELNAINEVERKKQDLSYKLADTIFVPVEGMIDNSIRIWPDAKDKIKLLPHGFDTDIYITKKEKGNFRNWFYAGTIMPGLIEEYTLLKQLISELNVKVDFFSFKTDVSYDVLKNENVEVKGLVSQKELLDATSGSGIALFMSRFKDYKSTKFYEIIKSGTFMLYIGKKGDLSSYIKDNKIGFAIETDTQLDLNSICRQLKDAFDEFVPKPHLADGFSFTEVVKIVLNSLKINTN